MAVVFRSTSDLLYLPDHGFVGEDGAIKILLQINRQIRRLDISHNLLGSEGIAVLISGLNSCRHRFSSTDYGIWGLRDINLGSNAISDDALASMMGYAKKDVHMRRVHVQGNDIQLADHLESIILSLNSSRVEDFSLTNNTSLQPASICKLFQSITTPHLTQLYLSVCNLGPTLIKPLVAFLGSQRSRNLEMLELNGNSLGLVGVTKIVDVIEKYNFTIKEIGLLANEHHRTDAEGNDIATIEEKRAEDAGLRYQIHDRLKPILERNRILTKRIRRAAIRVIAPARILLMARPLNEAETAKQAINSVSEERPIRPFRLLDLPREVQYHIVRHCSRDPTAFSEAQFTRIRTEAEDRESMAKTRRVLRERLLKAESDQLGRVIWEVREEWLRKGKWDRWELDRPLQGPTESDLDVEETDNSINGVDDQQPSGEGGGIDGTS